MATRRPTDYTPEALAERAQPLTEDEEYDLAEDNLRLAADGTMTTYHEGDEEDENSEWYGKPPGHPDDHLQSAM